MCNFLSLEEHSVYYSNKKQLLCVCVCLTTGPNKFYQASAQLGIPCIKCVLEELFIQSYQILIISNACIFLMLYFAEFLHMRVFKNIVDFLITLHCYKAWLQDYAIAFRYHFIISLITEFAMI